jgi:hypothetical protein
MHFFRTAVIAFIVFAAIATARPVLEEVGQAVSGTAVDTAEAVGDAGSETGRAVEGAVKPVGGAGDAEGQTVAESVKEAGQDSSEEVKRTEDTVKSVEGSGAAEGDTAAAAGQAGQDSSEEVRDAVDTQSKQNIILTPKEVENVKEQGADRVPEEVDIADEKKTTQSADVKDGIENAAESTVGASA